MRAAKPLRNNKVPALTKPEVEAPELLRSYLFHKLELKWTASEATGDCPFCGKVGKFFIGLKNGLSTCQSASCEYSKGGNIYGFMRLLHAVSLQASQAIMPAYEEVQAERRIPIETLQRWGMVQSVIDGEWLIPGYGPKGEINNLYRWTSVADGSGNYKRRALGTATIAHTMFGLQFGFMQNKLDTTYITEAPFEAMALDAVLSQVRVSGGKLTRTPDREMSIRATCHVLAVPGCKTFREEWVPLFADRNVTLVFNNDHPKVNKDGRTLPPAAYGGLQSAVRKLSKVAGTVKICHWGDDGYNLNLPSGYDIRDQFGNDILTEIIHTK